LEAAPHNGAALLSAIDKNQRLGDRHFGGSRIN